MKLPTIDNSAAAGMASAVLTLEALPSLYLIGSGLASGWQVWLSGLLSVLMLFAALLVITGKRSGWKIGGAAAFAALSWLVVGAFEHPVLLKIDSFGIGILEALVVLTLASLRLTQRADPVGTDNDGAAPHRV